MGEWTTSVNELVRIFRMALVALIPAMDAARIPWKDREAYDEWDEISQSLYRNVVVRTLHWAHGREAPLDDLLPPYNMRLRSYTSRGVVLVAGPRIDGVAAFVGLSSVDTPFDTVDCARIDDSGVVVGELVRQPVRDSAFSFAESFGSLQTVITDFRVQL